jgi:hypothetical protein
MPNTKAYAVAKSGLTLITIASPSGASAVNINNCFTSAYQNYVITYNLIGSTGTNLSFRLRNGGTDRTTSNYDYFGQSIQSSGTSGGWFNVGGTKWDLNDLSATRTTGTLHLFNPQETSITSGHSHTVSTQSTDRFVTIGFNFNSSTSNDGFSIFPDSGTFTGTVRVYGLSNN